MAEGLSTSTANAILAAIVQATPFTISALWAKLHVGAPGAAGTANPATETVRVNATACFGVAPASGEVTNDTTIGPWAAVAASEDYTHITFWTASSGGTFVCSGLITAAAVTAGDDFDIPVGDCTLSFPLAS